jgi:cyanate permease
VAAVGPIAAGLIADNYGTFAPIYVIYAGLMIVLSIPIFLMQRPAGMASTNQAKSGLIVRANAI